MATEGSKSATMAKASAANLMSEEERTPLRLQSKDPDLKVVVGGVEFYHYQQILCMWCPFFDVMLSNAMKEKQERKIHFPDKKPGQWLQLYELLNPATQGEEWNSFFQKCLTEEDNPMNGIDMMLWMDYLGMETLVKKCDKMVADKLKAIYMVGEFPSYDKWSLMKTLPCPLSQEMVKVRVKHVMLKTAYYLSREHGPEFVEFANSDMKRFLLDDRCADELWQFLLNSIRFPDSMLQNMSRPEIVNASLFLYMVERCGNDLTEPVSSFDAYFNDRMWNGGKLWK